MKLFNNKSSVIVLSIALFLAFILLYNPRPDLSPTKHETDSHVTKSEFREVITGKKPEAKFHKQTNSNLKTAVMPVAGITNSPGQLTAYLSKQIAGIVGVYGGNNYDHPADNIFTVYIDRDITPADHVWLNYKLTGIDHHSGVSCSINDRMSFGGYLVKTDSGTSRQRVPLHNSWITKGENSIRFGIPENAPYGYKITELSLEVERRGSPEYTLVVDAARTLYNGKVYVHGYVDQGKNVSLRIGEIEQDVRDGEFEAIVPVSGDSLVVTAQIDKLTYQKTLRFIRHTRADYTYNLETNIERTNKLFASNRPGDMETGLARLKVPVKALSAPIKLSLSDLRDRDLPALDLGMTNVTGQGRGVRFLPHGNHFAGEGASVALKYDRTKIPDGYTENDIRTYYFDPVKKHWVALERDSVDKSLCMVVSRTTHFTDMINGVIKAPESPETEGFAPTMMNDIKVADPASKIQLIAPPTANNQGSANLSYPIELPPSRGGMSPQLSITYNSDGGSGWLGEGWDLNIPDIKVDTRWGVPRYDPAYETETYSMGGMMLATVISPENSTDSLGSPSVSHRGNLYERSDFKQFHPVVENGFSRIVRYGNNPNNYYWVVTDKNGISYLYGANTKSNSDNEYYKNNDILTGQVSTFKYKSIPIEGKDTTNQFVQTEWKLSEVIDLHGVFNKYVYEQVIDTIADNVYSKRLVLKEIKVGQKCYNLNADTLFYRIKFVSNTKKDIQKNNGRYGFLVSDQNQLLDSVIVYADTHRNGNPLEANDVVRQYAYRYKTGAFNTALLERVIQLDNNKLEIASHEFSYYNTITNNNQPDLYNTSVTQYSNISSLSSGHTNSNGWSAYVGVGAHAGIASGEVGYQHAFGNTQSYRDIMLIDINGDGLPDKLFKYKDYRDSESDLCFMPNDGNGGFGNLIQIEGAPAEYMYTESKSYSDGWQGDVSAKIPGKVGVGVNAGMDWTKTYSRTTAYFQDVNNDGLVDIVHNQQVYFNSITYQNGIAVPSFSTLSKYTQNPIKNIKTAIGKSEVFKCQDPIKRSEVLLTQEQLELIKRSPLQDMVRVWEAPYSGTISINGSIRLLPCNAPTDGIVLRIQHENNDVGTYLINSAGDSAQLQSSININAGERIYFRLQSGTGILSDAESDVVTLMPTITYVSGVDNFYDYGYNPKVYKPSEASMINKFGYNLVDTTTTVNFKGSFIKPVTSDWVKLTIFTSNDSVYLADSIVTNITVNDTSQIRYRVLRTNSNYQPKQVVWSKTYDAGQIVNEMFDVILNAIPNSTTQFWFEISSNTNIKWNDVKWYPELHYNSHGKDTVIYAGVKYNMYSKRLRTGGWIERAPNSRFCGNNDFNFYCKTRFNFSNGRKLNSTYTFHLYDNNNNFLFGKSGNIVNNVLEFNKDEEIGYNAGDTKFKAYLFINDTMSVNPEILEYTFRMTQKTECYDFPFETWKAVFTGLDNVNILTRRTNKELQLGHMWRGWGQFQYNCSSQSRFMNPLVVDSLYIPTDIDEMDSLRNPFIYRLIPEPLKKLNWQGSNRQIYIEGDTISTGRNNIETIPDFSSGASYIPRPPLTLDQLNLKLIDFENVRTNSITALKDRLSLFRSPKLTNKQILYFGGVALKGDANNNPVTVFENQTQPDIIITDQEADSLYKINNAPILSTTSESRTFWGGASAKIGDVSSGGSGSKSSGSSITTMAFVDMNGDGYPDYITDDKIEYTNARGSRDGEAKQIVPEATANSSWSIGINGGYSRSDSPNSGGEKMKTVAGLTSNLSKNPSASVSLGYSHSENDDQATNSYIDVNGDGLPDRIFQTTNSGDNVFKVCLNLGYGFSEAVDYGIQKIQSGKTHGNSIGLSGNVDFGYVGGGISDNHSWSTAKTLFAMRDMNGDGLVDQIFIGNDNACYIAYNLGNRFTNPIKNEKIQFINETVSDGTGTNRNLKITIPILPWLSITAGGSQNLGTSSDYISKDIQDINGDGYPDLLSLSDNNKVNVLLSTIGQTNKLQSVTNSLGGRFSVGYTRTKATNVHPGGKWVMSEVNINDGISVDGENIKTTYEYAGGKHDRYEREFLGFAEVKIYNINTESSNNEIYRCTKQVFDTLNYYSKGNLLSAVVYEGDGTDNKKYTEDNNEYYSYSVSRYIVNAPSVKGKYGLKNVNLSFSDIVKNQYIMYSPVKYSISKLFTNRDGSTQSMNTSEFLYDYYTYAGTKGEIKTCIYSDKGNLGNNGSGNYNYKTLTEYLDVYSLPIKHTVIGGDGLLYRQVFAEWDPLFSNHLLRIKNVIFNGDVAITDFTYDKWGNILQKKLPVNNRSQRMSYSYTYGDRFHQYLTKITDSFGYTYQIPEYDYRFGIPLKTIDINGNVMIQSVDDLGRITSITGPNEYVEGAPNQQYTLQFDYFPQNLTKKTDGSIQNPAYAITKHYDPAHPDDAIETVSFVDGFGRSVQVKKDGYVDGQPKMIVSGRVKYDALGRAVAGYYPRVNELSQKTVFDADYDTQTPTRTYYDVMDRVTKTVLPDGSTTEMTYDIADGCLRTTVKDALQHVQETYTNGSGLTVRTTQYAKADEPLNTYFVYDPVNRLKELTDAMGKKTTSEYDKVGRRTSVTHPASGETKFVYDAAGNLLAKQTANLLKTGDSILYEYDYNRLRAIKYPHHPENNVTYTYGDSTDTSGFNRKGRLVMQEDGSGRQEFKYGRQGELTEVSRTLVIPNQAVATYTTRWNYDSWNRLRSMTYPDGEDVNYSYNTGGLLTGVASNSNVYVADVKYDKFEQRTYLRYGNGKETKYTYDNLNRQLKYLKVGVGEDYIMNNAYTYDSVGNVISITNTAIEQDAANTVSHKIGGKIIHNYMYDNLYRLDSAYGDFNLGDANQNVNRNAKYNLKMQYDNMHNIIRKKQSIEQTGIQFAGTLQAGYDLNYAINADNSQQISNIAENSYRTEGTGVNTPTAKSSEYSYDANGNLIYIATGTVKDDKLQATNTRKLLWDEENRLLGISDNGYVSQYWYDASGERTVKESFDNEGVYVNGALSGARTGTSKFTAYVSPYMVVSQGGNYTKHVYMGSQRITSKLSNSRIFGTSPVNTTDLQAKLSQQTSKIKERFDSLGVTYNGTPQTGGLVSSSSATTTDSYFYHPDHLGSSSLITSGSGDLVQHIQYVPFGEVFVEERNASWSTPYKFNGKEQDEETGLCYYGARYYDPRTSVWLSVDPLAEKNFGSSSYVYCNNNPIMFIDPIGLDTVNISKSNNGLWNINSVQKVKGNDVFNVNDGKTTKSYTFSEGEYGKRVDMLNLESNKDYTLGVYYISGAKYENETGYYVTKGGDPSTKVGSGKRLPDDVYVLGRPGESDIWRQPLFVKGLNSGYVGGRGVKFHFGYSNPANWTEGCFILSLDYSKTGNSIHFDERDTRNAVRWFDFNLGATDIYRYDNSKYQGHGRIGAHFPLSFKISAILKSR